MNFVTLVIAVYKMWTCNEQGSWGARLPRDSFSLPRI